ncbi:hypothetical protein F0A16_16375 [Salinicola corii]|uniref:Uncharacterized protein n=1 Tax=Salinicola corii TaxID=2606937 RepID=A0A640W9I6_9GAMM|nr:hypothetical protein [Salinicola corii]KAA0016651.1 hypothetical protein F0A16_16375 [Salinicola corii]
MTHQKTSKPRWTGVDMAVPRGTLQDAGEVEVLAPSTGATRHRYAMVIAFDSEEALRQAVVNHRCAYRDSQRVQELNHG